ncbi:MAG: SemiSWEET family sugar transporter [Burkholderiales bacterium]
MEVVGYVAGAITTLSFLPQLILTVRSRQAEGVSLRMYLLFSFGVALWITYGVFRKSPAVVLTNAVTLLLTVAIVGLVVRARFKRKQHANSAEGAPRSRNR